MRRRRCCSISWSRPRACWFRDRVTPTTEQLVAGGVMQFTIDQQPYLQGFLPILQDLPPFNEDGVGGMHLYMPWWLYGPQKAGKLPFAGTN